MTIIRKASIAVAMSIATLAAILGAVPGSPVAPTKAGAATVIKSIDLCTFAYFDGSRYVFDCGMFYTPQAGYHVTIDHYTDGMMHTNIDKYAGGVYYPTVWEAWNKDRILPVFIAEHSGGVLGNFVVEWRPNWGRFAGTTGTNNANIWNCVTCYQYNWGLFFYDRNMGGPMTEVAPTLIDSWVYYSWDWDSSSRYDGGVAQGWCKDVVENNSNILCDPARRHTSLQQYPWVGEARVRAKRSQLIGWHGGVEMVSQYDYGEPAWWSFD